MAGIAEMILANIQAGTCYAVQRVTSQRMDYVKITLRGGEDSTTSGLKV